MTVSDQEITVELDLRGAAHDGECRVFAMQLLEGWGASPPPFAITIRNANALGAPLPETLRFASVTQLRPKAILSLWPLWPWRAPAPVVLFIGRGAESLRRWQPGLWRARQLPLVLAPSRQVKVELQVLRGFRRDRVWALDTEPTCRVVENALLWLAMSRQNPPELLSSSSNCAV